MDTIFSLATAQGRAGVAVVRISGPQAARVAVDLMSDVPVFRGLRTLHDGSGAILDQALVLRFEEGASFTGEEVIELHLHGSIAVVGAVLRALGSSELARPAEAGEFTRRAFENGKLDLAQVEGLADLIDAETEAQRKLALNVLSGALGKLAEGWRANLIRAAALIEATIDFADEEVPVDVSPEVISLIEMTQTELKRQSSGVGAAEQVRQGFEVAIVGPPNAGKSTLLNRLAGREAAITSEIAGTTRDVIEVRMDVGGLPVTFLDTAGLRETDDLVEGIGVERAKSRAAQADLRIYMLGSDDQIDLNLESDDIVVRGKDDKGTDPVLGVSGTSGFGIERLITDIQSRLETRVMGIGVAIRERHRVAMDRAALRLETVLVGLSTDDFFADLVAEDLRDAVRSIDSLVGRIDVEDVLGEIFSSFCIGK